MEEIHRDIFLKECRIYLLQNLGDVHMIVEHLYAGGEFTEIEKDEILSKRVSAYQRSALLDLLPRKGPTAYATFIKALESEGCGFVVEALKDAEESLRQRQSQVEEDEQEGDAAAGSSDSPEPSSDKPRLVATRFDVRGAIAFDPNGNLLCFRNDGTASLFRASNGSLIHRYDTKITHDIQCVAISDHQIAVIMHMDSDRHAAVLFTRNNNRINFKDGVILGGLSDPYRCVFTGSQWLVVTERTSKSIALVNGYNLVRRIPLDFEPYDISMRYMNIDSTYYVSDHNNPQIELFDPDETDAGVFQCKDQSGKDFQPFGIAVGGCSRLYVCDYHGNRIFRLNDDDQFEEWLSEKDGVEAPMAIAFNEADQLAVYSKKTGKILFYQCYDMD